MRDEFFIFRQVFTMLFPRMPAFSDAELRLSGRNDLLLISTKVRDVFFRCRDSNP